MPDPISAVGAAVSVGGSLIKGSAANKAANAQTEASMASIAETRAAREEMRKLLEPYTSAGTPALQAQMAALGLGGPGSEEAYILQQEQSPIFQSLARQGEGAILQNASATGGLRGGNVQGALAQFRPALLNLFLENRFTNLGGITTLGQRSAAGVGTAGMESAKQIGGFFEDIGSAKAGAAGAQGQMWGNILGTAGGLGQTVLSNAMKTPGGLF